MYDYPLAQVITNSILSVLTFMYVLVFKLFLDKSELFFNLAYEAILSALFVVCGLFLLDDSDDKYLCNIFVWLVVTMIVSFIVAIALKVLTALKKKCSSRDIVVAPENIYETDMNVTRKELNARMPSVPLSKEDRPDNYSSRYHSERRVIVV